jgi:predicted CXXCH cytochrome family protein
MIAVLGVVGLGLLGRPATPLRPAVALAQGGARDGPAAAAEDALTAASISAWRKSPPPPTGLHVVAARANTLTWDPSPAPDVVGYRIYRAPQADGPYERIGSTAAGAEWLSDSPPSLGIFWYRVTAVNAKGREGAPCAPVSSDDVHMRQTVGPDGGVLEPSTGTVRLEIPAGALQEETTVTIDQLATPPPPGTNRIAVSRSFDIGPEGLTFLLPAQLTLRLDIPPGYPLPRAYPEDTTWVQYWDGATWLSLQGATVDRASGTVRVSLTHLSTYGANGVTEPHGGYSSQTQLCGYCHTAHRAPGPNLHPYPTEKETCYQCHDGTGASTDIRSDFGEAEIGSSTKTSFHPVPAPQDSLSLTCGDCHTPHRLRTEFTFLLRVWDGGAYRYSTASDPIGNAFCYACHGPSSAYPAPLGDHTAFETSVHNTDPDIPDPPAGATGASSEIRCLACHEPHASDQRRLTLNGEEQEALCYTCHTQADPNTSGGSNPYRAFTAAANDYTADANGVRLFHHPISDADQPGGARQVECASCHNPHLADATDGASTSKIVDPANTSQELLVTWQDPNMNRGTITAFCTRCHVSPTTTQPITAGTWVPYTIRMVNDTGPNDVGNGTPHDKFTLAEWNGTQAEHGGGAVNPLACTACHDFHGSSNAYLLRERIVNPSTGAVGTMTGWQADQSVGGDWQKIQGFCLTCHPERGTNHGRGKECIQCHYHTSGRL